MLKLTRQQKIKFTSDEYTLNVSPHPQKSKRFIPSWFKKLPKHAIPNAPRFGRTVKTCVPFLDAISCGYIIPAWRDFFVVCYYPVQFYDIEDNILFEEDVPNPEMAMQYLGKPFDDTGRVPSYFKRSKSLKVSFSTEPSSDYKEGESGYGGNEVGKHDVGQVKGSPVEDYKVGKFIGKLNNPWLIETPKGWSMLFTNPLNRWSNLEIVSGIVDTDSYHSHVNFPFFWRGSEEGEWVIKKGTPLINCIPIKRSSPSMKVSLIDKKKWKNFWGSWEISKLDFYKINNWHKKR